jgi:alpha-tubulin suppressor-like RCC1 family protein/subtilisin-like proprotein convertase family protein
MARYGLRARAIGVVALAVTTIAPLVLSSAASAVPHATAPGGNGPDPAASAADDPPWTHAFAVGGNSSGQLGNGSISFGVPQAIKVNGAILGFRQVSAGSSHSLAIATDGTVYAWGHNIDGQLGSPPVHSISAPVQVAGLSEVVQISAGGAYSLALRSDGTVWAWGANHSGQLGDDTRSGRHVPAPVPGLSGIRAIAAGARHSLAIRSDGTVVAWGENESSQLGDGTRDDRLTPTVVAGLTDVILIDAGDLHTLAVRSVFGFTSVWAWGGNAVGQLGDGTRDTRNRPVLVSGLGNASAISAGTRHSLAMINGFAMAWGRNFDGELGDGTDDDRLRPVQVAGLFGVRAVTAGNEFSAAVTFSGAVWAWGSNTRGNLGDGTDDIRRTPVRTRRLAGATQVSAGGAHMLAVQPVPAPRFGMVVSPSAGTLAAEGGLRIAVNTSPLNDFTHTIALSVSGVPAGVTATFDPPTVVAGGTSTLVLSSTELAQVGPATLTITATATPATPYPTTITANFALTVTPGCAATNNTDLAIPDGGPPATSTIVFEACANPPDLTSSTVEVHIVHPRRGDLVLDLIDPSGRTIRVKNSNPADTRPNMNERFQIHLDPDLRDRLFNTEWRLRVQDVATGAVGHLNSWTLHL